MTRTRRVLEAGRVCHEPDYYPADRASPIEAREARDGWVDDGLAEVEHAFERFLLALDELTFESLLASLRGQGG